MALSTWTGMSDPFFGQIERAMDNAMSRAFGGRNVSTDLMGMPTVSPGGDLFRSLGTATHPVDIVEKKDAFDVVCDAPGMSPEDIKVEFDNGVLTISGQKKIERDERDKEGKVWRNERQWRQFSRSFSLPENVQHEAISASLDKGVLRVCVPKAEQAKTEPKRIAVQAAGSQVKK